MKRTLLSLFLCLVALCAFAEDKAPVKYVDALNFRIINKGWPLDVTETPYTRFPAYLKDSTTRDCYERSMNSSGIAIRFASNSTRILSRYHLTHNFHMVHMADTGTKGTDLYVLVNGKWQYVNTCRPTKDSIQTKTYVENLDGQMHEYMIYLPLYDGIVWFEIGVDSASVIEMPHVDMPRHDKKIVFYGTSILQGGCSSRTGMTTTNMVQRDLNMECVNLAVSGEGKLVYSVARAMTTIDDVVAYVVDPVTNCTLNQVDTLTYEFIHILHDAHPEIPIIMVDGLKYPYMKFDSFFGSYLPQKSESFHNHYLRLKKEGMKNLYWLSSDGMTGKDEEGTVDGIHLTDLGFRAYADILEPILLKALGKNK